MSKKVFPATLPAIKRFGVESWLKSFSLPVHADEYQKIFHAMMHAYMQAIPEKDCQNSLYQTAIASYKIHMELSNYYYNALLYTKCKEQGFSHIDIHSDITIEDLLDDLPNTINLLNPFECKNRLMAIRERWRQIRVNLGHYNFLEAGFFFDTSKYPVYLIGDRECSEILNYIKERQLDPFSLRPALFIKDKFKTITQEERQSCEDFCNRFLNNFKSLYSDIHNIFNERIREKCLNYLIDNLKVYNSIIKTLSQSKSEGELLISPIGNIQIRLFAAAWMTNGGQVTAFSHGNSYVECFPTDVINGSHMVANKYVASSFGDKLIQEHEIKKHQHVFVSKAEIISTSSYQQLFQRLQKVKQKKCRVKKILISGFPIDYMYYFGWKALNSFTALHFEISVIKALKDAGYYVIYKAHPDSYNETKSIYPDYADEYMTEDFSTAYSKADCLLYTYPGTTTFGFALMTNSPIVVFCENIDKWHSKVRVLLEKRCKILPISLDKNSRVVFDREKLINAVKDSSKHINHEVVEEFALK